MINELRGRLTSWFDSDILTGKQVLGIYFPLLGEQLFFGLVAMLGTWMIASEGEVAVSAVTMVNAFNMMFMQICQAFGTGGTVVVAQYTGAQNPKLAAKTLQQSMSVSFLIGLAIMSILLVGREGIVRFFLAGAPPEVLGLSLVYFTGISISIPFFSLYQGFAGGMRGWGRTKIALNLTLFVNCMEIALSALLVLALHMGVVGIASAIVVSRVLGSIIAVIYILRHRVELSITIADFFHPVWPILRGLMMVATPVVLEQTFFHSGRALTQRFIASYGTTHMVANAASSIVYNIGAAPSNALTTATLTIIGMCIGRERIDLAKEYTNKFVRTTTILCLIVLIPIFPFTALINRLYNVTAEAAVLTYMAVGVFHIGAPLFMGRHTIVPSALRSGGDAVFTSLVALLSMWLVRVTLALLFTRVLSMGVVGVISAMVLEWGVRGVVFGARYKTDKWYRHSIIIRE